MWLYSIFAFFDGAVYSMVKFVVRLIMLIANYDFFSQGTISEIAKKIYVVLGVLMLFKMVITAIQYMINPDAFDDKDKGMGGLLKKMIVAMALLVLIEPIFNFAMYMQKSIITAIPSLVLDSGESYKIENSNPDDSNDPLNKIGDQVAGSTIKAFVNPKKDRTIPADKQIDDTLDSFKNNITYGCDGSVIPLKGFDVNLCNYDYMFGLSTAAGLFLLYVMLSMALDVGIRAIKLGIIQIFAPIPISSYIVSKDKLSKFAKLAMNVYLDLFIRLGVIYFIIFFIKKVIENMNSSVKIGDSYTATGMEAAFVKVAIIVALFMFAKNAPKFISEILGINGDGFGDMKDMFKPAWQRAGAIGAATGMGKAFAGNAINKAKFTDWKGSTIGQKLKNAAKVVGSGAAGAASAGFHGGIAAAQGKDLKEVNAAGYKRAVKARQNRDLDKLNGVSWADRAKARMADSLGIDTTASLAEGKQKAFSTLHQDVGNYKKAVMGRITKEAGNVSIRSSNEADSAMMQLGHLLAANKTAIDRSGNEGLMTAFNKFNMTTNADGTVTCHGLRDNQNFTYSELRAIGINAQEAGIGNISDRTREDGDITLLAQKELFSDAMKGKVKDATGNASKSINVKLESVDANGNTVLVDNKDVHVDISTVIGQTRQHIAENAVNLGKFTDESDGSFEVKYTDKDGNIVSSSKDHPVAGAEMLQNAFETNFAKFDDSAQKVSAKISREMGSDSMAAARASLERRNANKDKK